MSAKVLGALMVKPLMEKYLERRAAPISHGFDDEVPSFGDASCGEQPVIEGRELIQLDRKYLGAKIDLGTVRSAAVTSADAALPPCRPITR